MEEKFKIIVNMDDEMFNIFQKSLEKERYEIVERKEKIVFVKKSNNVLTDNQKAIILSIARKQKVEGILFVDITSAVQYLIKIPEEKMKNDGQFSWMMRQSFLKAMLEKDKNFEEEKMQEYKKDLIEFNCINNSKQISEKINNLSSEDVEKIILFYAMNYVANIGEISISRLLSKFNISYLLAQKIIRKLEEMQFISKNEGFKPYQSLISNQDWNKEKEIFQRNMKIDNNVYEEYLNNNLKYKKLDDSEDKLLVEVINFVIDEEKVLRSSIKDKFKINYNRVEKIIEQMEARDIISKKEKILITKKEWKENIEKIKQ